ncbi:MAG: dynamin family protein [Clostridiaceae bacterium]
MKVIKIKGEYLDTEIIKSNLEKTSKENLVFILDAGKQLYEFLENLGIEGNLFYHLKIANEEDFSDISVKLNDKITDETVMENIHSLSSLLEAVSEEDIKNCRLIFDTEDSDFISRVTQAIVYLDLELEVMMKKEKKDRLKLNAFRRKFDSLKLSASKGITELQRLESGDEFLTEKMECINSFYQIQEDIEKARDREINISLMSTKKAGKSVLVNSLLKEQYSPTSLELPTSNKCIYRRSRDNTIRMFYGSKDLLFKSPKDIYEYVYKEFKKAQKDKDNGYITDDMEIYYKGTIDDISSYTIIDTPGSNYIPGKSLEDGENMHKKLVYECIEKSDVVLFLINYSNYLTADEEKFFKDIKSQFEKLHKFYSLIIVVNKLDEMYTSECENKSEVRFLDYIRYKLYELGYSGFVVIGTSARTYSDIIKVSRIDGDVAGSEENNVPIENLVGADLRARIKSLKRRFIGKNEMSSLAFIDGQLENIECFYGITDYSLEILRQKSGIPKLEQYTSYVAMQKANVELYRKIIEDIDEKFHEVNNRNIITKITTSRDGDLTAIQEVEVMVQNTIDRFNSIKAELEKKISFEVFQQELFYNLKNSMDRILNHMLDIGEARIDEFFMKLLLKTSRELKEFKEKTTDIEFSINKRIFLDELNATIEETVNCQNIEISKREEYVREAEIKMRDIAESFSEKVRKEYEITELGSKVPLFHQEFNRNILLNIPPIDINDDIIKEKIRDSIEFKQTYLQRFLNNFRGDKLGSYFINSYKLRKINIEYIEYLRNGEYDKYYNLLKEYFSLRMEEGKNNLIEICGKISGNYEKILNDMFNSLSNVRIKWEKQIKILDNNLEFYIGINEAINDFIEEWETVRNAGK